MASKSLFHVQRLLRLALKPLPLQRSLFLLPEALTSSRFASFLYLPSTSVTKSRSFSSRSFSTDVETQGPAAIDYRLLLQEDEFQKLANSTIHDLLEKLEDYGDTLDLDGFDIDYGNEVLTLKLGDLGTYVLNKQTPNRQLWLSSPISGPSRFDWDGADKTWIYRRTKANLVEVLERELEQLCGKPIDLT